MSCFSLPRSCSEGIGASPAELLSGAGEPPAISSYTVGGNCSAWSSGRSPQADTLSRTVASISSAKSFCMDFLPFVFQIIVIPRIV